MAIQDINHGTIAGDETGEDLFTAFEKTNANFVEMYAHAAEGTIHFTQASISITESQISDFDSADYLPLSGGVMTGNTSFTDSNKLFFGNGSDASFHWDGTELQIDPDVNRGAIPKNMSMNSGLDITKTSASSEVIGLGFDIISTSTTSNSSATALRGTCTMAGVVDAFPPRVEGIVSELIQSASGVSGDWTEGAMYVADFSRTTSKSAGILSAYRVGALLFDVSGSGLVADELNGFHVATNTYNATLSGSMPTTVRGLFVEVMTPAVISGTPSVDVLGIQITKQDPAKISGTATGIWLAGDDAGADIVFGAGQDASIYYNASDLVIDPALTGSGRVNIQANGLTLPAGTATAGTSPLKLQSGTLMTTPEDGAMEYIDGHLYFTDGVRGALVRTYDVITSTTTFDTTAAKETIYTYTLAADGVYIDQRLLLNLSGHLNAKSASEAITFEVSLDGSIIHTIAAVPPNGSTGWKFEYHLTVRTIGSSGTVIDFAEYSDSNSTISDAEATTHSINTTTSSALLVTAQWGTSDVSNSISVTQGDLTVKH